MGGEREQQFITIRPARKKRLLMLFFPMLIAFCGVLFSWDISHPSLRALIVIVSVFAPTAAICSFMARYHTTRGERLFFVLGCAALAAAAIASVAGLPDALQGTWSAFPLVTDVSHTVGTLSLMLGLGVVAFMSLRSQHDIEELGESFRQLADHIDEGFLLCDLDGEIKMINQRLLDMLGLREAKLRGKRLDYLTRLASDGPVKKRTRPESASAVLEYEFCVMVNREERRFVFSEMPVRNQRGAQTGSLTTVRDITEHHRLAKRVERYAQGLQRLVEEQTQKLHRYENRYRRLLLSMNEGFLTLDASNCVRIANARVCRLLELGKDEIRGRPIFDFIEGPGRMRLLNILARGEEVQGAEARLELDFITSRGGVVPTVVAISYIGEEAEWESVFSMVVTNVSELKRMQQQSDLRAQELERVNEELRMHGRAKDGFLSNVTHELRTPLSTISGYIEMLESGGLGELEAAQQGALKVMRRNASRLEDHIKELIEFSRMEIQGVQMVKRLFSSERLVREAAASVHPHALDKVIRVVTVFGEGMPSYAWGDRDRLLQVLGILLNNAVKFTGQDGHIELRVGAMEGDTLSIAVRDTGIGIDTIHQEQIFKKFFQVDSSKTRRFEGTGIGLSIARSIVQAHGGAIKVDSLLGEGSTFTVTLPDALFKTAHDALALKGFDALSVIAVNEEQSFDETVCAFLKDHVRELYIEPNGYNCVRIAEQQRPDFILINDSKIDHDAVQIIDHLRENEITSAIPVIVFCGEVLTGYREIAALRKDVYFVLRPFDICIVLDRIRLACFGEDAAGAESAQEQDRAGRDPHPHVLIVDADPGLLEWVEMVLQHRKVPCYCAPNVAKAHKMISEVSPDIVFLDADLPMKTVREQLALLGAAGVTRGAPVYLMIGAPGGLGNVPGAAGCIKKPFSIDDMVEIIENVRRARDTETASAEALS